MTAGILTIPYPATVLIYYTTEEGGEWKPLEVHAVLFPTSEVWDAHYGRVRGTDEWDYYQKVQEALRDNQTDRASVVAPGGSHHHLGVAGAGD